MNRNQCNQTPRPKRQRGTHKQINKRSLKTHKVKRMNSSIYIEILKFILNYKAKQNKKPNAQLFIR